MLTLYLLEIKSTCSSCVRTTKPIVKVNQMCPTPILWIVYDWFGTHLTKWAIVLFILYCIRLDGLVEGMPTLFSRGWSQRCWLPWRWNSWVTKRQWERGEPPVDPHSGDLSLQSANGFCEWLSQSLIESKRILCIRPNYSLNKRDTWIGRSVVQVITGQ